MMLFALILLISTCTFFALWKLKSKEYGELSLAFKSEQEKAALLEKYRAIMDVETEVARIRVEAQKGLADVQREISMRQAELDQVLGGIRRSQAELDSYEIKIDEYQQGFYTPKYEFEDLSQFSEALDLIREAQRVLLREKQTVQFSGNKSDEKVYRDISRLAVSAFNGEFLGIVEGVTPNSFDKCRAQLDLTFEKINKQILQTGYQITDTYLSLKQKELALVNDYRTAEQKQKEEQAELKAAMREEEKARVEAEKAREKAIKEQERYQMALEQARKEMESKSESERSKYESQLADIQRKLDEATAERERATSMAQITKTGHVYIISNMGSFGENVLKIGMTRRKDPQERIHELGDASVPFGFDVHAMVYTEDAPALENALHRYFDGKRMNLVNTRKEFFQVTIDDVAEACQKLGYQIKLSKLAEASEYRQTLVLREQKKAA